MSDNPEKPKSVRVALTKTQAAEGLGRELIELSRGWLEDGKLEAHELDELRAWLAKAPPDSIPAIQFIKEEVQRYIEDGEVCDWELCRLQAALIRVIPPKERAEAKAAREAVARVEWEKRAPEREAAKRASAERSRELRERYAEIWAEEPATEAQLEFIRSLGGSLSSSASKLEASELIDRLLGRESSTARSGSLSGCLPMIAFIAIVVVVGASFIA